MIDQEPGPKISLAIATGKHIQALNQQTILDAGFQVTFERNGQIHAKITDDPLIKSITFARSEDIPLRIEEGVIDFGMFGRDVLREAQLTGMDLQEVVPLGKSRCEVVVEVPNESSWLTPADLNGIRIATSLPRITNEYFGRYGASVITVRYTGQHEGAIGLGAADAVVAIWYSGSTARENGLRRLQGYETILHSEAVLATSSRFLEEHGSEYITLQFIDRFRQAVRLFSTGVEALSNDPLRLIRKSDPIACFFAATKGLVNRLFQPPVQ